MSLPAELAAAVRERAADRCQYCLMHQSLQGATFHVEHIVPRAKGGSSRLANLACIEGLTPIGRATVAALDLNHPRRRRIRAAEKRLGLYPPHIT